MKTLSVNPIIRINNIFMECHAIVSNNHQILKMYFKTNDYVEKGNFEFGTSQFKKRFAMMMITDCKQNTLLAV